MPRERREGNEPGPEPPEGARDGAFGDRKELRQGRHHASRGRDAHEGRSGDLHGSALAQETFIYPTKGQSPEQQNRDRYECHTWAVQQTGFDPTKAQAAQPAPAPQQAPQGGVVRGAARGAAVGAVGGAIAGDAGKGAAIGAATGGMIGGMRRRDQQAQQAKLVLQVPQAQQDQLVLQDPLVHKVQQAILAPRVVQVLQGQLVLKVI